uniref:Peptidase M3A/M3B catalytic domain-containing protein n=1 Tax=Eutreptiella gymnastica TaxID=73025 RepID=A0A7S1JHP8_9EUGL
MDLLDRQGKYSNGFCHWPQPAWRRPDGTWVPSVANFTSLATPGQVGSGHTGLVTLLHEGGHAAHFANIDQPSPFFSQERAPMSVAYAENQSIFLEYLHEDAAWLGRFARNAAGRVIPWEVIEKHIRATHPYSVTSLRAMLAVPYFEKRLYELPEAELSVETLLRMAAEVERDIQGGAAARPLLSVPHILADEASCYYHGYVLAEMSVHQTRAHFLSVYGTIVDNPNVGRDLTQRYWRPGNGTPFLDLVKGLTGKSLAADAWVKALGEDLEHKLTSEKAEYEKGVAAGARVKLEDADLGMRVLIKDGDDVVCDSNDAGLGALCSKFSAWVGAKSRP